MERRKKRTPEQIVSLLRQVEIAVADGKTTAQACNEAAINLQSHYRWRKLYGGHKADDASRLKELELENSNLRRLVAELSLHMLILKDLAARNF
jgi:hypothetical protein